MAWLLLAPPWLRRGGFDEPVGGFPLHSPALVPAIAPRPHAHAVLDYYIASAVQELIKYGLVVPGETLIAGSGGGGEVAAITCSGGVEGLLTARAQHRAARWVRSVSSVVLLPPPGRRLFGENSTRAGTCTRFRC